MRYRYLNMLKAINLRFKRSPYPLVLSKLRRLNSALKLYKHLKRLQRRERT